MSLFTDILPYVVFILAFGFLVLWFIEWLQGILRKKGKKTAESRADIIEGIKVSLNKVIESLDKLNNQK